METQWLSGSFCPLSASLPILSKKKKKNNSKKYIPKCSRTLIIINRHAEATPSMCIMGNEGGVMRGNLCLVLCEWVDKCYMSASCLKTLCMISLSSEPTEITAGDERRARLSQQTTVSRARSTTESCNLESNELSMTTVGLSDRDRKCDGLGWEMPMCSKLMQLPKLFRLFVECNKTGSRA